MIQTFDTIASYLVRRVCDSVQKILEGALPACAVANVPESNCSKSIEAAEGRGVRGLFFFLFAVELGIGSGEIELGPTLAFSGLRRLFF